MMAPYCPPPKQLTPAHQLAFLNANPLCVVASTISRGRMTWTFAVRPTPLSRGYACRNTYNGNDAPMVEVVDPDVSILAEGKGDIPHVYHNPLCLCLFYPKNREWTHAIRIDQTFIE